jgi:ATP-binding cassette subfamily D (ALD) long-chain fatty acid import protein
MIGAVRCGRVAGTITRPQAIGAGGLFFLPQRPYLTRGTLRQQIVYPHNPATDPPLCSDREVYALLHALDLAFVVESWGLDRCEVDWGDVLSGGESQRLGFARLFYHKPKVAVMDEATSALDVPLEVCFSFSCLSPSALPFTVLT